MWDTSVDSPHPSPIFAVRHVLPVLVIHILVADDVTPQTLRHRWGPARHGYLISIFLSGRFFAPAPSLSFVSFFVLFLGYPPHYREARTALLAILRHKKLEHVKAAIAMRRLPS